MQTVESEELPVRLAHRVKELDELPHNLSTVPSIKRVKNWYAQSFEVKDPNFSFQPPHTHADLVVQELITFPPIQISQRVRQALMAPRPGEVTLPESIPNPSLEPLMNSEDYQTRSQAGSASHTNVNGNGTNGFNKLRLRIPMERRSSVFFFFSEEN